MTVDVNYVLAYMWAAAWEIYGEGSMDAEAWVTKRRPEIAVLLHGAGSTCRATIWALTPIA